MEITENQAAKILERWGFFNLVLNKKNGLMAYSG
jgi:hypothetical protein